MNYFLIAYPENEYIWVAFLVFLTTMPAKQCVMKLFWIGIQICLCCSLLAQGRNPAIDSLQRLVRHAGTDSSRALYFTQIGYEFLKTDADQALVYYTKAFELHKKNKNREGIAYSLIDIGTIHHVQGQPDKALSYYFRALKIQEKAGDKSGAAYSLINIGHIYKNQRQLDQALGYFLKSLKLQRESGNQHGIAFSLNNIGSIYHGLQRWDKALEYYTRSLKIRETIADKDGMAVSLNCVALIHMNKGNTEKALHYLLRSLQTYEQIGDKEGITYSLNDIGDTYKKSGNYPKALAYARKSLDMAKELGYPENIKRAARLLSEIYALQKDYKLAYEHYQLFSDMKDSIFNTESKRQITEMSAKYQAEKKENKIKLLEKDKVVSTSENKRQRLVILLIAAIATAALLIAVVIFRSLKLVRQQKTVIEEQKKTVEEKNKDITDSINYAKRIQQAILPPIDLVYSALQDSFILYKPKDVVSGDFYFFTQKENKILLGAVDCTGHGVPGAFMSMIGHDQLNHIIIEKGIIQPAEILNKLNKGIKHSLKQNETPKGSDSLSRSIGETKQDTGGETKDGMDVALVSLREEPQNDAVSYRLEYAGANRPLYIISGDELKEIKADKTAIAGHTDLDYKFTHHEVALQKGDAIYLFSDGFYDQFGGENGKKIMTKKFKKLLLEIQHKTMREQEIHLNNFVENWKAGAEQVDDILVIGVRL